MDPEKLAACQQTVGYTFRNVEHLNAALTHSSAKNGTNASNERLEFLGDAILGMVVSDYVYHEHPDYNEGELTKIKSVVVSRRTLARIGDHMGLRDSLVVGRGIADRKGIPRSMLANAFEAIVAAVYLDGGMEAAREFVLRHVEQEVEAVQTNRHEPNHKSILQQYSQQHLNATPLYQVVRQEGPDHVKMFHVIALINDQEYGSGWGRSKKQAEQRAAQESLAMLAQSPLIESPDGPHANGDAEPSEAGPAS